MLSPMTAGSRFLKPRWKKNVVVKFWLKRFLVSARSSKTEEVVRLRLLWLLTVPTLIVEKKSSNYLNFVAGRRQRRRCQRRWRRRQRQFYQQERWLTLERIWNAHKRRQHSSNNYTLTFIYVEKTKTNDAIEMKNPGINWDAIESLQW